jgi:hypothetical protein
MAQHLVNGTYTIRDDVMDVRTLPEVKELLQADPAIRKRLDAFKACSYMTNTHSTKELKKREEETRADLKDTIQSVGRTLSTKMDVQHAELMQELANVRMQMLSIESRTVPRIFAIQPKPKDRSHLFNRIKALGREDLMLNFFCEAEVPHLAPHPGYELHRPSEFIRKYGPMIAISLRVLQYAIKVSPLPVGEIIPKELIDMVGMSAKDVTGKMIGYTNGMLADYAKEIDGMAHEKTIAPLKGVQDGSRTVMDEGMQKAFIEEFIKANDKTLRLGNLKRCTLKQNGKIVWLCQDCLQRLDVLVAEDVKEFNTVKERVAGTDKILPPTPEGSMRSKSGFTGRF